MAAQKCFRCDAETTRTCAICGNPACDEHRSIDDPEFCEECVSPKNTAVVSKPLIDDEGVEHEGRQMTLEGDGWLSSMGVIAKLTDEELPRWIERHRRLLNEAEQRRDYNRIMLGALQMESEDRRKAGVLALKKAGAGISYKIASSTVESKPKKRNGSPVSLVDKLKAAGVTAEMLQALLAKAQAKK